MRCGNKMKMDAVEEKVLMRKVDGIRINGEGREYGDKNEA